MAKIVLAVFLLCIAYAACDLYLHNPRGSNDRLNEANTNRNNGNRLFDSQNNAKGGYCVGPAMTYYEGSLLTVEWTSQHGCGANPKMVCNIVLQYMCSSSNDDPLTRVRDGTTTNRPNANEADATAADADGELTYGVHESLRSYLNCNTRKRNTGLYIADRAKEGGLTAGRATSIYTRQNNNGDRNGYECAEERDYYPYWHPSQWRDIAILASNKKFCDFYQSESQNVKSKGYCYDPNGVDAAVQTAENNPSDCTTAGNTWTEEPAFGIPAPDCVQAPWSRENQLGNGMEGHTNNYNMTMPKTEHLANCINDDTCACAIRIRYNISTIEDGYPDMSRPDAGFIDYNNNGAATVNTQDPVVNVTDGATQENGVNAELELAMDTSQFGRTFQDRTHTFKISKRPAGVSRTARLFNLNVRGKRGNIVQTYPSTEYDFVPQTLYSRVGDYIHFQWTGCDTNPAGNAGEGTDQTDRSNLVQIRSSDNAYPVTDDWIAKNPKKVFLENSATRVSFATLDQTGCNTREQILSDNGNNEGNAEQNVTNCGKLNAASQYFDGGVLRMNKTGTFYFMNTRNHNFSNRDQKGAVIVEALLPSWAVGVVVTGAVLFVGAAAVAGLMFYAKGHPHSGVANMFSKI